MQLKKRPHNGICHAMRCKQPVYHKYKNGVALCEKHTLNYQPSTPEPLGTQIVKAAAVKEPTQEVISELIAPIKAEADGTLIKLQQAAVIINSQKTLDLAGDLLRKIKTDTKEIEKKRKSVTKPLLDTKKEIDGWFKPALNALKECETYLKDAIAEYVRAQETRKIELLQAGETDQALALTDPELPAGISARAVWSFEVTDPDLVPREYLTINYDKIGVIVSELKDKTAIPGVKVSLDTSIAARSA